MRTSHDRVEQGVSISMVVRIFHELNILFCRLGVSFDVYRGKTAVTLIHRKVVEGDTWIMFMFCMVIECHVRFMLEIMPSSKWHVSRILMSTTVAIGKCGARDKK